MRITLVGNELGFGSSIQSALHVGGIEAQLKVFQDPDEGLKHIISNKTDLIVLDSTAVSWNVVNFLEIIKSNAKVPVLVVSVRRDASVIYRALESGAADYIVKPISQLELLARLKAIMRKAKNRLHLF